MRHLISPMDLTVDETDALLALADRIVDDPKAFAHKCDGKKLATLFFEPSTRTRLSFEAAMLELGGGVLGFSSADSSSASKGESVADTARTVSCYADIIAMRHPKEGAPLVASRHSLVPVSYTHLDGHAGHVSGEAGQGPPHLHRQGGAGEPYPRPEQQSVL